MTPPNRHIIWDFDGTLGTRTGKWVGAMQEVLHAENPGLVVTMDDLRPFLSSGFRWHNPEIERPPHTSADAWWAELEPIFTRAFCSCANLAPPQAALLAKKVRQVFINPARWSLFPDTLAALESLSARGWRHILLTNHIPELPQLLQSLGLDSSFDAVFNSAQTGLEKPHPRAFETVLSTLPPESRVWMVGDNPIADIQGAHSAGIPAILVRNEHPSAKRFAPDLSTLAAILESSTS